MPTTPGDTESGSSRRIDRGALAARLAIAVLCALAMLQGVVFVAGGSFAHRIIVLLVVVGSVAFALAPLAGTRRLAILALLGAAGFIVSIAHVMAVDEPFPLRVLQTAVLFGYTSLCLAAAGAVIFRPIAAGLLVSAVAGTLSLVAVEAAIELVAKQAPGLTARNAARWIGGTAPHPVLEDYYPPRTEATTLFEANPRGYFRTGDQRLSRWKLGINHAGSAARLVLPGAAESGVVRLEVDRAEVPTPWHIQLGYGGLAVRKDEKYVIAFHARADRPRKISYNVGQNHPPWQSLGSYQDIAVDTDWREYVEVFLATGTDDEARVSFNFGETTGSAEIKGVEIKRVKTGASAVAEPPPEYAVNYRFNDQGCRGPDYPIPAPPNRRRILALGDSFTLAVGVYEEDTFTAQLQAILNAGAEKSAPGVTYDVINCGVSGYGTLQERQLFEVLGPRYRPDIVIVAMVSNDDSSWRSDVRNGYFHQRSRYERLFLTWGLVQHARYEGRKPPPEFSGSLRELLLLRELCARMNARLVVVAFRNAPLVGPWHTLVATISTGLAGSGALWLDVGERLMAAHQWNDLVIFPDVDMHPNEIAHRSAAEQIAGLLEANGVLR